MQPFEANEARYLFEVISFCNRYIFHFKLLTHKQS
jgi:hypothetical protein